MGTKSTLGRVRRTMVAAAAGTGAFTLGAITVGGAAPASADLVSGTFSYACHSTAPSGYTFDVKVGVSTSIPQAAATGESLPRYRIYSTVTFDQSATAAFTAGSPTVSAIDGSFESAIRIAMPEGIYNPVWKNAAYQPVNVDGYGTGGPYDLQTQGSVFGVVASTPGTVWITLALSQELSLKLNLKDDTGATIGAFDTTCSLKSGQNLVLGSYEAV